jgi:hypothetical protein
VSRFHIILALEAPFQSYFFLLALILASIQKLGEQIFGLLPV